MNDFYRNVTDSTGLTALVYAAKNGTSGFIDSLITAGASMNTSDYMGFTPLLHAAKNGHLCCVNLLIRSGADVNAACYEGKTALMYASYSGHNDMTHYLINAGADVCRKVIRKYLINTKQDLKLHINVPELGLPSPLASYLLYYTI